MVVIKYIMSVIVFENQFSSTKVLNKPKLPLPLPNQSRSIPSCCISNFERLCNRAADSATGSFGSQALGRSGTDFRPCSRQTPPSSSRPMCRNLWCIFNFTPSPVFLLFLSSCYLGASYRNCKRWIGKLVWFIVVAQSDCFGANWIMFYKRTYCRTLWPRAVTAFKFIDKHQAQ